MQSFKALIGFGFLIALLVWANQAWAVMPELAGNVSRIKGTAFAVGATGSRRLSLGSEVYVGDTIVTGKPARVALSLKDASLITLGDQTRFAVVGFDKPQEDGTERTLMRLVKGAFRALASLRSQNHRYEVATRIGTIGIRGTDFWGGFSFGDGGLHVIMVKGKGVYVQNDAGKVELDEAGKGTVVKDPLKAPTAPKFWPDKKTAAAFATVSWD